MNSELFPRGEEAYQTHLMCLICLDKHSQNTNGKTRIISETDWFLLTYLSMVILRKIIEGWLWLHQDYIHITSSTRIKIQGIYSLRLQGGPELSLSFFLSSGSTQISKSRFIRFANFFRNIYYFSFLRNEIESHVHVYFFNSHKTHI